MYYKAIALLFLAGNEGRHFTLKDNTSVNVADGVAPPVVPHQYSYFPSMKLPFVGKSKHYRFNKLKAGKLCQKFCLHNKCLIV